MDACGDLFVGGSLRADVLVDFPIPSLLIVERSPIHSRASRLEMIMIDEICRKVFEPSVRCFSSVLHPEFTMVPKLR